MMKKPRNNLMPAGSMGAFHVVSRCLSWEFPLDCDGLRKRLALGLARWFSHVGLELYTYAIMSNHVRLVLRLQPDRVASWDAETVTRHAHAVMPARTGFDRSALPVSPEVVGWYSGQEGWMAQQRERLSTPSGPIRLVKQEIALCANRWRQAWRRCRPSLLCSLHRFELVWRQKWTPSRRNRCGYLQEKRMLFIMWGRFMSFGLYSPRGTA